MRVEPVIRLEGVYKRLGNKEVLCGVDFEVERGETFVILGRSGTGKSVTLRHIVGLMRADRGLVRVLEHDIGRLRTRELREVRRHVGYLFQDGALLNWMTVFDNVALPLREGRRRMRRAELEQKVASCLCHVEMQDAGGKFPNQISGGMRKRAGLARALVCDPEIVLYDEPTSGLDPISSNIINDLIRSLKKGFGMTQVVVTHDMQSAYRIGDRLALLHDGKILAIGTPEEFQGSRDPAVAQFTRGEVSGPLSRDRILGSDGASDLRRR